MLKIKNIKNFNLNDTVTCGQIFRYQKEEDDSYTIILKDRVINVKYDGNNLYVDSNNEENLKEVILKYFDLDRDYSKINKILVEKDNKIILMLKIPNSEKTEVINNFNYVNEFSFKMDASSSAKVMFYKDDPSQDYTYPIINDTSIINVTVETAE